MVAFGQGRGQLGLGFLRGDEDEAGRRGVGRGRAPLHQVVQFLQQAGRDRLVEEGVLGTGSAEQLIEGSSVERVGHRWISRAAKGTGLKRINANGETIERTLDGHGRPRGQCPPGGCAGLGAAPGHPSAAGAAASRAVALAVAAAVARRCERLRRGLRDTGRRGPGAGDRLWPPGRRCPARAACARQPGGADPRSA
ncbi:hypothetical protein G6F23_012864 [Rhizopus arrhizus]|nr:hypothetical protein G6F23_012864 [Rhizopus arrhizus]